MKHLSSLLVAAALLFAASPALACEGNCPRGGKADQTAQKATEGEKLAVYVANSTCESCVSAIKTALVGGVKGILDVVMAANDPKSLIVTFSKGSLTDEQIVAAIKKAGYEAEARKG